MLLLKSKRDGSIKCNQEDTVFSSIQWESTFSLAYTHISNPMCHMICNMTMQPCKYNRWDAALTLKKLQCDMKTETGE